MPYQKSCAATVSMQVKVVIDAYILGTLFHYIVKKDPEVEAAKELMQGLRAYSSERQLPPELASKMVCSLFLWM